VETDGDAVLQDDGDGGSSGPGSPRPTIPTL